MRDQTRELTEPGQGVPVQTTERARWRVERYPGGRMRVTVECGTVVIMHTGTPARVHERLQRDTPAFAREIATEMGIP